MMNSRPDSIVFSGQESEGQIQSAYRKRHSVAHGFLMLAVLVSVGRGLGQVAVASSLNLPTERVAAAALDSLAGPADSLMPMPPDEQMQPSSGTQKQAAVRRPILRREKPFTYKSGGRRDPFRALISEKKSDDDVKTDLLRLDGAVLTGVVWSGGEYLAMVRDSDGNNFFLREGDAVFRGRIVTVTQTKAVFRLVAFGEVERVTLTVSAHEGK